VKPPLTEARRKSRRLSWIRFSDMAGLLIGFPDDRQVLLYPPIFGFRSPQRSFF
jgi:hypothetical protein